MTIESLVSRLDGARHSSNGWAAKCPAHEDRQASLSIGVGAADRILVNCFAGCTPEAVVAALGLGLADLMPESEDAARALSSPPTKTWVIRDASGAPIAEHHRQDLDDGKRVWWTQGGRNGLNGAKTADLPLYACERLSTALADAIVIVTEGEKAADALLDHNFVAVGTVT
jgi:putative DNA primase/helicase